MNTHTGFWFVNLRRFGRPGCRSEDNMKIGLKETGLVGVAWITLAYCADKWKAVVNMAMNFWVL